MITTKRKIGKWLGSGLECIVYEYGNDKVIKIYAFCNDAKHAIRFGCIAFENGIGPKVFSKKSFIYPDPYKKSWRYAIICERVKTAEVEDFDYCDGDEENGYEPVDERYDELCAKCTEVFGSCIDLHLGNLGWSKDGQLIMIDFGPESTSDYF